MSGISEPYIRMWTDGTSFFWVDPRGLVSAPVAGGPPTVRVPSPLIGSARAAVHDATTVYAFVASPPSLVTQPLAATSASEVATLATLPDWTSGVSLYDDGDRIVITHMNLLADDSVGPFDIVTVSKASGVVTPIPQPADSYDIFDVDPKGDLLASTRTYTLSSFTLAGVETVLFPSTAVQAFAAGKAAHGADGTVYVGGQLLQPDALRQPAFAVVRPGGVAELVQCGAQTDMMLAGSPEAITVGASAVYGLVTGGGEFEFVKLPK